VEGREGGGVGGGATTSWEGELPRYAPPNNIMEMEADALFVDDVGYSREDFMHYYT